MKDVLHLGRLAKGIPTSFDDAAIPQNARIQLKELRAALNRLIRNALKELGPTAYDSAKSFSAFCRLHLEILRATARAIDEAVDEFADLLAATSPSAPIVPTVIRAYAMGCLRVLLCSKTRASWMPKGRTGRLLRSRARPIPQTHVEAIRRAFHGWEVRLLSATASMDANTGSGNKTRRARAKKRTKADHLSRIVGFLKTRGRPVWQGEIETELNIPRETISELADQSEVLKRHKSNDGRARPIGLAEWLHPEK
jgi:hypothetical protein